jgi:PleD family two-component response regulator
MADLQRRPRLVLIASQGEWVGRSVESVLELNGYTVLRVEGGRRALDVARRTNPDALILDLSLSEMGGIDVCRALTSDPLFDPSTAIFITAPAPVSNRVRAEAFESGAWDFCTHPLDVETMLLKLSTFVRARHRLEDLQAASLIDPLTGLYSMTGLHHWAEQLCARAARQHEPFACLAVTAEGSSEGGLGMPASAAINYLADICRAQSRKSDVVGYVGESRFAILAPETNGTGARQFVGRLQRAVESSGSVRVLKSGGPLRAGFYAVSDFGAARVEAAEVVRRAEAALQFTQSASFSNGALSFDELPAT